jgi:hypothetical protein
MKAAVYGAPRCPIKDAEKPHPGRYREPIGFP